ncbi:MAG TPA: glycosyltransferase family 39 protein [Bryobacterales bacterium]|nr:glycosyltransferase family 39 protein [Bryobacterales bacterium]
MLAAYGLFLFLTNALVIISEDEANIASAAGTSMREWVAAALAGQAGFHHPPLSEVVLHFWLRWTGERLALLRVPSIVFYCLALWIVAETAELLWGRRWTAVALGVAWPAGFLLGRPAGWYALSMLEVAGLGWCYFLWRKTGPARYLAAMTVWAVALAYTNYFGWVFLATLGADLLLSQPQRRQIVQFLGAAAISILAFLPLATELLNKLPGEVGQGPRLLPALLRDAYLAHSLLASEMAAPWTWPGMVAAACGAGFLWMGLERAGSRRALLWLALPLGIGFATGVVSGVRLILFGPGLLLFLASVLEFSPRRMASVLVAAAFGVGWIGMFTGRFAGTHRYTEPWPEAAARVAGLSRPGDVILCNHPSFYFYVSYQFPWEGPRRAPNLTMRVAGRTLAPLYRWRLAAPEPGGRFIYVRTALMPWGVSDEKSFLEYAAKDLRLAEEVRYDRDRSAEPKNRWFPEARQPEWRIRIEVWERKQP